MIASVLPPSADLLRPAQPNQLARLLVSGCGAFSCTRRRGLGLLPMKVALPPFSFSWPEPMVRGGLMLTLVLELSPPALSPETLLVSLRMPGKLPAVGAPLPEEAWRGVVGPLKNWALLRPVERVGERGPSGPLYIAFTKPAPPENCSLMGRLPGCRRVDCARPRPMGMLGAVSGLL